MGQAMEIMFHKGNKTLFHMRKKGACLVSNLKNFNAMRSSATRPKGYFKIPHGTTFRLGLDSFRLLELRHFTRSFKTGLDLWKKTEIA